MSYSLNSSAEDQDFEFIKGKHIRFTSIEASFLEKVWRICIIEIDIKDPPLVVFRRSKNGSIVEYSGICYEIIHVLRDFYHFSYEVVTPSDREYGTKRVNGSWNGMIAMILSNEADMGIAPFSVTYERKQVVDFTEIYDEEPNALLIPPPMEDSSRLLAFTKPFQSLVSLGLCFMMIFVPIILWLLTEMNDRKHPINERRQSSNYTKIVEKFQSVFAVLVSQRYSLIFIQFQLDDKDYACDGSLVSQHYGINTRLYRCYDVIYKCPKSAPVIVKSLDELPSSLINWLVSRGTSLESLFMEAKGGIYLVIGNGLRRHPEWLVNDAMEGKDAVITGKSAYIAGKPYLEQLMEQDPSMLSGCYIQCLLYFASVVDDCSHFLTLLKGSKTSRS